MTHHRNTDVAAIEAQIKAARQDAIEKVKAIQDTCSHAQVIDGGERRICAACGLEEAYDYPWPGRTRDGGFYVFMRPPGMLPVLKTEFVKQGSVVAYRISI